MLLLLIRISSEIQLCNLMAPVFSVCVNTDLFSSTGNQYFSFCVPRTFGSNATFNCSIQKYKIKKYIGGVRALSTSLKISYFL